MGKESSARTTLIKVVVTCLVVALSFCIIFIGEYNIGDSDNEDTAEPTAAADMSFTPGTYTAAAPGMESDVEVTATFDEDSITDVSINVSGETAGIGAEVGDEMTQQFLAAQSASVDGVSGASVTSGALMDAMQDCIDQASGGGSAEAAESEEETEAAVVETAEEAMEEETEEPAAEEEAAAPAAEAVSPGGSYTPGTYTAAAQGINGEISVSVTFTENAIVSIGSDLSCETEDIGGAIGPDISKQILDAQSTDVDGVSGATITSDAFKSAVNDCIAQASSGNAASEIPAEEGAGPEDDGETDEVPAEGTSAEGTYIPGTYAAEAQGISSAVTVTLSFDENSILSAGCDVSGETEDIGGAIGPEVCAQILNAQSAEIDGVSGATITSDAVKEAAAECIAEARGEE